tara:strand:- start:34 stop:1119 length:1086 start_codon:yes stop_codon:yes gene_type:complete
MANPRETKIAELKAKIEAAKAEIAQLQADEQAEVAAAETGSAMNFAAAAANQTTALGLGGRRNADGDLEIDIKKSDDEMKAKFMSEAGGLGLKPNTEENHMSNKVILMDLAEDWSVLEYFKDGERVTENLDGSEDSSPDLKALIEMDWFQEAFGDEYDSIIGSALEIDIVADDSNSLSDVTSKKPMNIPGVEIEEEVEEDKPKLSDITEAKPMNIPGVDLSKDDDEVIEDEVIEDEDGSIVDAIVTDPIHGVQAQVDKEKDTGGRNKRTEIENLRGEKAGWEMKEDSNFWSVNEKDPYWKTQEGYDEAVDLYGKKPSWLKDQDVGTLVYNPSTGEYEEVEQEEFEDLSSPAISADIKKLFG